MARPPLVPPGPELTAQERTRYARHLLLPDLGTDGQRRLRAARVLVVGAGRPGLPGPALPRGCRCRHDRGRRRRRRRDDQPAAPGRARRRRRRPAEDRVRGRGGARDQPETEVVEHRERLDAGNALDVVADYDLVARRRRQLPDPLPRRRRLRPARRAARVGVGLPLRRPGVGVVGRRGALLRLRLPAPAPAGCRALLRRRRRPRRGVRQHRVGHGDRGGQARHRHRGAPRRTAPRPRRAAPDLGRPSRHGRPRMPRVRLGRRPHPRPRLGDDPRGRGGCRRDEARDSASAAGEGTASGRPPSTSGTCGRCSTRVASTGRTGLLLDVREAGEREIVTIPGAVWLTMDDLRAGAEVPGLRRVAGSTSTARRGRARPRPSTSCAPAGSTRSTSRAASSRGSRRSTPTCRRTDPDLDRRSLDPRRPGQLRPIGRSDREAAASTNRSILTHHAGAARPVGRSTRGAGVGAAWWNPGVLVLRRPAAVAAPPRRSTPPARRGRAPRRGPARARRTGHRQEHRRGRGRGRAGRRDGVPADACLLLAPTRLAAARLRDAVTARLGGTTTTPLARTHQSFGFGVLREAAALAGDPAPRLLSGPEQDVILARAARRPRRGQSPAPPWPRRGRARPCRPAASAPSCATCSCAPSSSASSPATSPARARRTGGPSGWPPRRAARVRRGHGAVRGRRLRPGVDPRRRGRPPRGRPRGARPAPRRPAARRRRRRPGAHPVRAAAPAGRRHGAASPLVLVGDPDAATQTFRGADPRLFVHGLAVRAAPCSSTAAPLRRRRRGRRGPGRRRTSGSSAGAPHAAPGDAAGARRRSSRRTCCAPRPRRPRFVAGRLREAHLLEGTRGPGWPSSSAAVRARRPCAGCCAAPACPSTPRPPTSRCATRRRCARSSPSCAARSTSSRVPRQLDPGVVVDVLASPVGGADAVAAAPAAPVAAAGRARRRRRAPERRAARRGGARPVPARPGRARGRPRPRVHRVLAAARRRPADGDGVEEVLWAMWSASGLAGRLARHRARRRPRRGRADRDLDAVLGLFDAAARFVDRLPGIRTRRLPRPRARPGRRRRHPRRARAGGRVGRPRDARRPPPASSGTSSSSRGCRRASGPTCGCAAPSSAPPTSSTS